MVSSPRTEIPTSQALPALMDASLRRGIPFRFKARGHSMHPFIRDRDEVTVVPLPLRALRAGEIVVFRRPVTRSLLLHRIREVRADGFLVQGDNVEAPDGIVTSSDMVGLVIEARRAGLLVHDGRRRPGMKAALLWLARIWVGRVARARRAWLLGPPSRPFHEERGTCEPGGLPL